MQPNETKEEKKKKRKLNSDEILAIVCIAFLMGVATIISIIGLEKGIPTANSSDLHWSLVLAGPSAYLCFFLSFLYLYFLNPYDRRRK